MTTADPVAPEKPLRENLMQIPLPDSDTVNLVPPDAREVQTLARGFMGTIAPAAGITTLQDVLITAICKSMTGHSVKLSELEPLEPDAFAPTLRWRSTEFRTRIVQDMLLGEMILDPIPEEVTANVARVANLLGVDDAMLGLTREYAAGNFGLALIDFARNGYTQDWDGGRAEHVHTQNALVEAWELCVDDPLLAARWASLENCDRGTLGRAVFDLYRARGFEFPGNRGSAPPYLAQHDWVHVLADYGTSVEAEIEVFGLIARAIPDPRGFAFLAMVIGLFETGALQSGAGLFLPDRGHLSKDGMAGRLADAMRRGASCRHDLMAVDWFDVANQPVQDVRDLLGIVPKSDEAQTAGSVGPFSPRGISVFQMAAGQAAAEANGRHYDPAGASVG